MTPEEQREAIALIRQSIAGRKPPVKVLVVEDNDKDAAMTMTSLEAVGVDATWARDTVETENFLVANDPWLVFLDLQLGAPVKGAELGLNILELIKSFKPGVHVVILTGQFRHDSENCVKALSRGAKAVMLKPLTIEQAQLIFTAP